MSGAFNEISLGAPFTANPENVTRGTDPQVEHAVAEHEHDADVAPSTETPALAHGTAPETTGHDRRSSGNQTLAEDGEGSKTDGALAPPKRIGQQASASSSMDFVGDLEPHGVSVHRGKEEFAALERRFSNMSQHSNELERRTSIQRMTSRMSQASGFNKPQRIITQQSAADVEKAKAEVEEFNLAEILRSGREKQDQAGIKRKAVGVAWDELEVIGVGGLKINIRNFSSAIIEQVMMPALSLLGVFGYKPFAPKPRTILHKNSGVLKPGEMCLVLGRPSAGCSTFLKSIANQRDGFMEVNGDVTYAGVGWKEMSKLYSG